MLLTKETHVPVLTTHGHFLTINAWTTAQTYVQNFFASRFKLILCSCSIQNQSCALHTLSVISFVGRVVLVAMATTQYK